MPVVVGVAGYAGSGKDTIGDALVEAFGFVKLAFADPLRRDIAILNPIIGEGRHGPIRVASAIEFLGYTKTKETYPEYRRLLQVYGTDVHRSLDDTYWVSRLNHSLESVDAPGVVVTDMRFPNERSGVSFDHTIRVVRDGLDLLPGGHESESYVNQLDVDTVLTNNESIGHLQSEAVSLIGDLFPQLE